MTYHGGVEDGMSAACARILRLVTDKSLPNEDKLDMIEQYCRNAVKEPIREVHPDLPDPQKIAPSWHRPWCIRRAKPEAQCNCNVTDVFTRMSAD